MSQPSTNKVTLLGFQLKGQSLVGIGTISAVDLRPDQDTPSPGVFLGWSLHLRGPMAYLVSPAGWDSTLKSYDWDPNGRRIVHRLASADLVLRWSVEGDPVAAIDKLTNYDSPPFGRYEKGKKTG